jgi:glutamine synthetase adenylyltransferase
MTDSSATAEAGLRLDEVEECVKKVQSGVVGKQGTHAIQDTLQFLRSQAHLLKAFLNQQTQTGKENSFNDQKLAGLLEQGMLAR